MIYYTCNQVCTSVPGMYLWRYSVLLLLFVSVPDGKTVCCCGSLDLVPVFSFSAFKHDLFFCSTPWQYCRIYRLDLPTTSSVVTGMHGTKASVSTPAAAKPPL